MDLKPQTANNLSETKSETSTTLDFIIVSINWFQFVAEAGNIHLSKSQSIITLKE